MNPKQQAASQYPFISDQWELLELLGEGGMSRVYKARHKVLNRLAAIKVLLPELVSETHHVKRFEQEARALSTLDHPNIVHIHDYGFSPNGRAYLIVDLIDGESLEDRLNKSGKLSVDEALPIFYQICSAVGHAHEKKVWHRDLKPGNIMLVKGEDGQDQVRIVDFGLSKLRADVEGGPKSLTRVGDIIGTPFYMSPEQCGGKELDHRSDIYAMGCLMYATLTGAPPFPDGAVMEVLNKHLSEPPAPMVPHGSPDSPLKRLDTITRKCLAKNRDKRYQSMKDLLDDLRPVTPHSREYWESQAKRVNKLHERPNRRRQIGIALVAALVMVAGSFFSGLYFHARRAQAGIDYRNRSLWVAIEPKSVREEPDFEQKRQHVVKAVELAKKSPSFTKRQMAEAFNKLAHFYEHNGHFSDAAQWYGRVRDVYADAHGPTSLDVATAQKNIGVCQVNTGLLEDAETSLTSSVNLMKLNLREPDQSSEMIYTHPKADELLTPLRLLEAIHSRNNELDKATAECREIWSIYRNITGHETEKLLWLSEAADLSRRRMEFSQSEKLYGRVLAGWRKLKGDNSVEAAKALYALALLNIDEKSYERAEQLLKEARAAALVTMPADDPFLITVQNEYDNVLWKRGRWFESLAGRLFPDAGR